MVLKIEKLAWENEQWMTVDPDGFKCSLASQQDCKTIFILRDSYWDEVYCGKVVNYEGEIKGQPYTGPVIPVQ